ncbi:immunoglobulin-like domain-containing protein, partial [Aliarcobacter cryaerophilus]|uniref:immunoglobulin-like domain-containing protein n=1 Tax=Aliarcobacter cryaerophilus TaxID=28198 RepID=UPI003BB02541
GYKTSYDAPAEGGTITVSATITDKAGNTSTEGKDSAVLDTTAILVPTSVKLNNLTVEEGTGTAKITATIDYAPTKEPLVITLSNGATVTFAVGETTAESTSFNIQGNDVYIDKETYDVTIKEVTNGGKEFKNLVIKDTISIVTINDTTDTVYVDVTADNTNLSEGAVVTYTVTLRNQDGLEVKNHAGLNITLSNGVKIYIPADETSGTAKGIATVGSNTIKVQTIVETATADSGKQFEAIQSGKTVTVNASSSTLKNDTAIATENGSENVASEDSLDTINGKNDGQNATKTIEGKSSVFGNDSILDKYKSISKITFEGKETIVKPDGNTEIVGKYGTLTINSKGEFIYKVNDENPDVDALNVGDKLAEHFTYATSNGKTAVLTVEVEGRNDAPIISKIETNGVTLTGIYNDYQKDNITKDITAHDLLKEDKGVIFNNENSNLSMNLGNSGTDVSISYLGGNGSYKNILGFYEIDANGNKINLKIMHIDKNSNFENLSSNPQELTQLKNLKGEIGFFLISDGYSNKDIKDAIDNNWAMTVDKSNNIIFKKGNYTVKADKVFYSNETSNNDGLDHTIALKQNNGLIIGFEDQYGGGDKDYDDFVISVKFTPSESLTNKLFTNVDFSDVDDTNLSEATVTLTNAIDGDKINIAGDLKEGITYTTEYKDGKLIIKFTGIASHEAYEEALEAIRFSTKNSENERELKFDIEIKDPNGKTDKQSVVIIGKGFDNDAPTIGNESVQTNEDVPYTFSKEDFKSYVDKNDDSIETIRIVTLPKSETEGVLKYDGEVLTVGKEIKVTDLGKLVFEPVANSDKDASFTFQVSDSRGAYSDIKTMTIEVEVVADAPTVSIDIKSAGTIEVSTGNSGSGNSGSGTTSFDKVILTQTVESSNNNQNSSIDRSSSTTNEDFTFGNINGGTKTIKTGSGNDEIKVDGSINGITISTGSGDDYIKTDRSADNTDFDLGDGNDTVEIYENFSGTIEAGAGDDRIIIGNNVNSNSVINTGSGNDYVQINSEIANNAKINLGDGNDGIRILQQTWNTGNSEAVNGGAGFDTLYLNGNHDKYLVYIKSTDAWVKEVNYDIKSTPFNNKSYHVISWETYAKLNEDANGEANREFYIMKVSDGMNDNKALKVTNFESISFDDKTFGVKEETSTVYKYDITVNAQLTDKDGSEKLSDVTIKNIPNGSTLYNGEVNEANKLTANPDGSYTIKVDANGEAKLSLTSESEISQDKLDDVQVSATSTDKSTDGTSEVSQAISFDGSGDIDLSNLKNISEINLDNGKKNKLSLTLEDVLKMSGDDNTIKISGDASDKVALKGENDWTKSQSTITEDNKTFDVYSGSVGDQTVQVKVEQPISDGITN